MTYIELANYNSAPDISHLVSVFHMETAHKANSERPQRVPLGSIVTAQMHFQPKLQTIAQPHNTTLLKLKEVIRTGRAETIPALVVFGSADQPIIVDGHHRLLAYRDQLSEDAEVLVEWFEGDYIAATAACLSLNDESRRCVYHTEKMSHIWRSLVRFAKDGALWDADGNWLPEHSKTEMTQRYAPTSASTIKTMRRRLTQLRDGFPEMNSGWVKRYNGDFNAFIADDPVDLAHATWPKNVDARISVIEGSGPRRSVDRGAFDADTRTQQIAAAMTRGCGKDVFANQHNAELIAGALIQLNSEDKIGVIADQLLEYLGDDFQMEWLASLNKRFGAVDDDAALND
ncbi:MAG: hypothetical protein CME02_02375 [Geminicoccus sp.]|nr:hypothetical protein [Geminicoccus sp.]